MKTRLLRAIAILEEKRGELGNEIVDIAQAPLREKLDELVISSSEGNPFYVEELIAMLVEDGVIIPGKDRWKVEPSVMIRVSVPSTLTGVLQARLDSLPDEEKEMLQKASVIGRLFWDLAVESLYKKA